MPSASREIRRFAVNFELVQRRRSSCAVLRFTNVKRNRIFFTFSDRNVIVLSRWDLHSEVRVPAPSPYPNDPIMTVYDSQPQWRVRGLVPGP